MKIKQTQQFQPIAVTLETAKEAELFWAFVRGDCSRLKAHDLENLDGLRNDISNWFSNQAQLGG